MQRSTIINGKEGDMAQKKEPLAYRMCPRTIDEFVGQEHIIGKGKLLYRMIKADRISSIILYGPPGTGKTSLARIIAATTRSSFEKLNAVTAGVADIKRIISDTQNPMFNQTGRTVLFIDEIHRFNKAQQDALLPYVENGTIVLIGATTENPYFEVNKALISRSTVFMLKPLEDRDIEKIIRMALADSERGLGNYQIRMDKDGVTAGQFGVNAMHDVTEGGVLGAVWELCQASGTGVEIYKDRIPLHMATRKICEYYNIDPYRLISSGCMLISVPDGEELVRRLKQENIDASVIGKLNNTGKRLVISGNRAEEISPPESDELYKIL